MSWCLRTTVTRDATGNICNDTPQQSDSVYQTLQIAPQSTCSLILKAIFNHERKANRILQTNVSNVTGNIPLAHAREVGTQIRP